MQEDLLKRWVIVLYLLILLTPFQGVSQTEEANEQKPLFNIDILFKGERLLPKDNKDIYVHEEILTSRSNFFNPDFNNFTDIPQRHASIFVNIKTKTIFSPGYSLNFDLFAEDRSQSLGSLNLDKVVLFPRIYGNIIDTLKIGDKDLKLNVSIGDLIEYQHNNGLTINNIDVQGINVFLNYSDWLFGYTLIGDLSQHVGLNLGEVFSYKIGRQASLRPGLLLVWMGSLDKLVLHQGEPKEKYFYTIHGNLKSDRNVYKLEYAYRNKDKSVQANIKGRSAFLVGFETDPRFGKNFQCKMSYNLRFYGKNFNNQFNESKVRYRDPTTRSFVGNYVGPILYPLINAERKFDQWSIYTEYQLRQIVSQSFHIESKKLIYKGIHAGLTFEGNHISVKEKENGFYTFYKVFLEQQLPGDIDLQVYATNKLMNLDIHYQTFYQAKSPVFGFSIQRLID